MEFTGKSLVYLILEKPKKCLKKVLDLLVKQQKTGEVPDFLPQCDKKGRFEAKQCDAKGKTFCSLSYFFESM